MPIEPSTSTTTDDRQAPRHDPRPASNRVVDRVPVPGSGGRSDVVSGTIAGALEESLAFDDDAGDVARGDEPAAVGHRDAEDEPAALDRLEHDLGRHLRTDRGSARGA